MTSSSALQMLFKCIQISLFPKRFTENFELSALRKDDCTTSCLQICYSCLFLQQSVFICFRSITKIAFPKIAPAQLHGNYLWHP